MNVFFSPWHWFGKSDEKCIPDDHLPPQNLDLHHHNRQKINVSQSHWMDVTLFFVGLSNKSVIKPVRGSSYSFEPWCNWCSRSGVIGVHMNLQQTFLHLGGKFNKNNSLHFTSWQNLCCRKRFQPHVLDCYVLHYYLSWYCHLAMERGVYMDELQTLQDFAVFRQALCLLMQYRRGEFILMQHDNSY
jgi:hypothetical protein